MTTFTSSLPDDLLKSLNKTSKELNMPKNKLIEKALQLFLDEIQKAKYAKSFQRASADKDIMAMAEEGMADYYKMLKDFDEEDNA
jgi:metal-responsive CopG/Arc/MetJ family transcriptional regulator